MALLITVFDCDSCGKVIALKTDADWDQFSADWQEDFKCQFCPVCRQTEKAKRRLIEHAAEIERFCGILQEKENAEFIN